MKHKNRFVIAGLLLIAAALFLTAYNLWDGSRAEKSSMKAVHRLEALQPEIDKEATPTVEPQSDGEFEIPDYILNPGMEMPEETIDGQDYIGVLEIPTLELKLPVISRWSYPKLKIAPCRYSGSAYSGHFVIAAHNYVSHFGRLKELRESDSIVFTDMDGNRFCYEVMEMEVLQPTALEEMESGDWDMTLFTCTTGGQSRVTVRCERIDDGEA